MNDITLITIIGQDRKHYDRFAPLVKEHTLSAVSLDVFKAVQSFYSAYPSATKVDWSEFTTFFFMVKKLKKDKADHYHTFIQLCADKDKALSSLLPADIPQFHKDVYNYFVKLDYLTQITNKALDESRNLLGGKDADFDDIADLVIKCKTETGRADDPESIFVPRNLSAVVKTIGSDGLDWPLEELNAALGPLRKGDFVVVGAYVETGKTTFAAHSVSHFVRQLKSGAGPIIWINNEEQSSKVMFRIIQAYFGVTTEELIKNATKYEEIYTREVGDRILIPADDSGYSSTGRLNRLFREYSPSLIVFDQLDKVHIHGDFDRDDIRLGSIYKWAREKSKEYCPIIAITQVDATGATTEYIAANQLRGSKVDKPAEADAIITIGKSADPAKSRVRYLHYPKNKLLGGPASIESLRHGYHEVEIRPEIARYAGTLKRVK